MHILALVWFSAIFALACWVMKAAIAGRGERMIDALLGRAGALESGVSFDVFPPENDGAVLAFKPRPRVTRSVTPQIVEPLPLAA